MSVGQHQLPAAPADGTAGLVSRRCCCCVAAAAAPAAPADGTGRASSSSKVKAGQWVTPKPTRPSIHGRIC